jgi:hypothetical protein
MKYNNQYYKIIAKLLDETVDNKPHTDLYYTKRIAESYGESYTDIGNINKYLRDFAKDVGVEVDNKHHTQLWYLKRIAEKVYDGELEHNNKNYYLKIISENINPTPPTPTEPTVSLKLLLNGEPLANEELIGYDSTIKYYTDENGEINNLTPDQNSSHIRVIVFGKLWGKLNLYQIVPNISKYTALIIANDETYQYYSTQSEKPLPSDKHIELKYEIDTVAKTITVTEL